MDHGAARRAEHREVWRWEEETMVAWLRDTCGLGRVFTAEEIHAAHGRILMNATSLDLERWGGELGRGAGLYPVYSMMNTSCRIELETKAKRRFLFSIVSHSHPQLRWRPNFSSTYLGFNWKKALVGAFSVIVKSSDGPSFQAL